MTATAPATATRGRFVWHELMTSDPAAAQKFYGNVVGWTTSKWGDGADGSAGMDYTMFMSGEQPIGGVTNFTPDAKAMGAPPNWLPYIEVPDTDKTVADTERLGGSVIVPATTMEGIGRFAILRDPQGAAFAVIASASALAEETDPQPGEFSWHELATTDLLGAIAFYEQLFGWKKQSEFDMGEMGTYHMFGRDRFTYGGMMGKPKEMTAQPTAWLCYAYVRDTADAAAERIRTGGGTIIVPPMEVPGGDRIAVAMDPQGAGFAVHSKTIK